MSTRHHAPYHRHPSHITSTNPQQVRSQVGAFAAPDHIQWAPGLPKTRSGKVMRRILRKVAAAGKDVKPEELGDTTTLAEPEVVQELIANHVFNK